MVSYFPTLRKAHFGGGDGACRRRLGCGAVACVAAGAHFFAPPAWGFNPLPFLRVGRPPRSNQKEQAQAAALFAPPETLPPWAARSALVARTRQDGAAVPCGALHSAKGRPSEAVTGAIAAKQHARRPAILVARTRARVLAHLSSPSGHSRSETPSLKDLTLLRTMVGIGGVHRPTGDNSDCTTQ